MTRVDPRRTPAQEQPRSPAVWRGTKALGAAAGRGAARLLRRLVLFVLVMTLLVFFVRSIIVNVRTPGTPTRLVTASDGAPLTKLRQAGLKTLTLSESDVTAAFQQAVRLPTFPFRDGQVAILDAELEVFGHLKNSSSTATLYGRPRVVNAAVRIEVTRVIVGHQAVPRWLAPLLTVSSVDQAALFAKTALPPVRDLTLQNASLTLSFE